MQIHFWKYAYFWQIISIDCVLIIKYFYACLLLVKSIEFSKKLTNNLFLWFFFTDWWYSMEPEKDHNLTAKRFQCDCGSSYSHNSSLRFHQRWECGKSPSFQCPICKYMFKRRSNMMKHINMVHGRKQR